MNVNKTFLNHYILHPLKAPSKRKKILYIIGSVALAIFCLGFFHRKAKALAELSWTDLTPQAIARMTPDEQGALIERGTKLSPQQLKAMLLKPNSGPHPRILSKQGDRKALCGLYAINNALQQITMTEEAFSQDMIALMKQQFGESAFGPDDEIDADPSTVRTILKNRLHIETEVIEQEDLAKILEKKEWAILYHQAYRTVDNKKQPISFPLPCDSNALYTLSSGHFAALRKDAGGQWWYLDSRFPSPSCLPLALIPRQCVFIVQK